MQVTKCDRCKKEIHDYKDNVRISIPKLNWFSGELHTSCAGPILRFLKQYKILPEVAQKTSRT